VGLQQGPDLWLVYSNISSRWSCITSFGGVDGDGFYFGLLASSLFGDVWLGMVGDPLRLLLLALLFSVHCHRLLLALTGDFHALIPRVF